MAQTKRKRRTKHRGTAAGTIETRGRTGRPPAPPDKKQKQKLDRAAAREARLNRPPSWRSALNRGALAAAMMFVVLLVLGKGHVASAVIFAIVALGLYTVVGYYTDSWQYKRRVKRGQVPRVPRAK